jgi:hypothetical protein
VYEHRDALVSPTTGIGEVKCQGTFPGSWTTSEQMYAAVSDATEPIVEQRDSAPYDFAGWTWHDG